MEILFQIGVSIFRLKYSIPIEWIEDFKEFVCSERMDEKIADVNIQLLLLDSLPGVAMMPVYETPIRRIYSDAGIEAREFIDAASQKVYGMYVESSSANATVILNSSYVGIPQGDCFFYNYFALEKHLIKKGQIILHACYVLYKGEAILFTAPSGTGKSTQGELWERYKGAQIINGDRVLVGKADGIWYAYGLPFSGTSNICRNIKSPVRAIVYLEQSLEDKVEKLERTEGFRRLYSEITINGWNAAFVSKACDIIEKMTEEISVYKFECTKEKSAVLCLAKALNI